MRPKAFDELWSLAASLAPPGQNPSETFGTIGLYLRRTKGPESYHCTPRNVDTFARTRGDGVHYSLLKQRGRSSEVVPVVMTVPMAFGDENHIVGENLLEFLALGCRFGYFALEGLAYDREGTIEEVQTSKGPPAATRMLAFSRPCGVTSS